MAITNEEELLVSFRHSYEHLTKHVMYSCSAVRGEQVMQTMSILDATGISLSMFTGATKSIMKKTSGIMQDNYPENLGQMFIVNAPTIFTGVWAFIKPFLDERTRKKI